MSSDTQERHGWAPLTLDRTDRALSDCDRNIPRCLSWTRPRDVWFLVDEYVAETTELEVDALLWERWERT